MKRKPKTKKRQWVNQLPDYRNTERGLAWLRSMIADSEKLDSRAKGTIEAPAREREPGEDDID